jgi:peptidoglycan/LPS O-acetylase OafA/YrhL
MQKKYLSSVHYLRGLAAFAVCLFHFTNGNRSYLADDNSVKMLGSYCSYGVQVFFIISGLVIPYAMYNAHYRLKDFRIFLWKRIVRIEPPYLISFLLVIALNFISTLSPYYHGKPFHPDAFQLLCHLGYLNSFYNFEWINPVYWTLAIEFQYYILIALVFPLLSAKNIFTWALTLLSFNLIPLLLSNPNFIFQYSLYFSIGIAIYKYFVQDITKLQYLALILVLLALVYIKFNLPGLVAAIIPVAFIFVHMESRVLKFLGNISYSLYLLHVPVGLRVINLSRNFFNSDNGKYIVILLAVIVTILASYLFYRYIELPCKRASKKIRYRHEETIANPILGVNPA